MEEVIERECVLKDHLIDWSDGPLDIYVSL